MMYGGVMLYCNAFIPDLFWIAVSLMVAVIAILYMLGKAFSKSEFEALAKVEFRELIISIAIAFGSIGLVLGLCNLSTAVIPFFSKSLESVGGGDFDQFQLAEVYISTMSNSVGVTTIVNLEMLAYSTYLIPSSIRTSTGVNILTPFRTFSDSINVLVGIIFSPLIASLNVQQISISVAKYIALSVILPAGIVARTLKPTREGGAFLIALAIGMHFIWPFLYLINYEITLNVFTIVPSKIEAPPAPSAFPGLEMIDIVIDAAFRNLSNGAQLLLQGLILPVLNISIFLGFVKVFSEFILSIK